MDNSGFRVISMAWYRREDYNTIISIMSDSHHMHHSFDVWLADAEQGERKLKSEGYTVVRAFIDPKTFPKWCSASRMDINSKARSSSYATLIANESVNSKHRKL